MRIPDEVQVYQPGDNVFTLDGHPAVVRNVLSSSVYYEARPIASYLKYTYVLECANGIRHYLSADQITSCL